MRTFGFVAFAVSFFTVTACWAQYVPEPNPANKPYVFLGGDKPKKNGPATSRAVKGVVVDESGKPVQGAMVTLLDLRTKEKWSTETKADGKYNFDELSFVVDYEVSASKRGSGVSGAKKLSQYDRTPLVVRNLELAPASATNTSAAAPAPANTPAAPPKK
jgi:Carboxypeptidase regulatory-like domain